MEKAEMEVLIDNVAIRMSDFEKRINQLIMIGNSDLSLGEIYQKISRKIMPHQDPFEKKQAPKHTPFRHELKYIYEILECYKHILPDYNELWLLYGLGDIFDSNTNNICQDDFVSRFDRLSYYITSNKLLNKEKQFVFEGNIIKGYKLLSNDVITQFTNVFVGINKLKKTLKLKDLNTSWVLTNEGDMFEKNENSDK